MIPSCGRAQLLRVLAEQGSEAAQLCGYEFEARSPESVPEGMGALAEGFFAADRGDISAGATPAATPVIRSTPRPQVRLLQVVAAQHFEGESLPTTQSTLIAPWEDPNRGDVLDLPEPEPLVPWPRLWRRLRSHLSQQLVTREIAMDELVSCVARADPLRELPRLIRSRFAARPRIFLDRSRRQMPFWSDQDQVCQALSRWTLADQLKPYCFVDGSDPGSRLKSGHIDFGGALSGSVILLLGDLGAYGGDADVEAWRRAGHWLKDAGATLRALCPCPSWRLDPDLAELWNAEPWDERERSLAPLSDAEQQERAERLLTMVAFALRIEPGLLRQARSLLPADATDSSTEADVLKHPAVVGKSSVALTLEPSEQRRLREKFAPAPEAAQQDFVKKLLARWHQHLPPEILELERLELAWRLPELFTADELHALKQFLLRALNAIDELDASPGREVPEGMLGWARRLVLRVPRNAWQDPELCEPLLRAWAIAHRNEPQDDAPPGMGSDILALLTRGKALVPTRYRIWQVADGFVVLPIIQPLDGGPPQPRPGTDALPVGSPIAEIIAAAPTLSVAAPNQAGTTHEIPTEPNLPIPWPGVAMPGSQMVLTSDRQQLTLAVLERPDWAKRVGRDEYGLFAEFEMKGVTQRMRWIAPGKFLMGSPEGEAERHDDELMHEVELTEGYWIADTACTQGLWEAVVGVNPSRFTEESESPRHPVEQVSWDQCVKFVERINSEVPGLALRLPTEAEWEYGCRAGTKGPFSFGETLTPEQVNYDKDFPYAGAAEGLYRGKTVPVGTLPVNPWGLFEMHGNVLEWCEDWFARYSSVKVTNPPGPDAGEHRVLRGGSWGDGAEGARSASRSIVVPGHRLDDIGFRLARGR